MFGYFVVVSNFLTRIKKVSRISLDIDASVQISSNLYESERFLEYDAVSIRKYLLTVNK
jgi:hypothetical protein